MPKTRPHLNRKLTLQSQTQIADNAGGYSTDWRDLGTVFGAVRALSGAGRELAGGRFSDTRYEIIVRATPVDSVSRPLPNQRFIGGGQVFFIDAVLPNDRGERYLACRVHEQVTA